MTADQITQTIADLTAAMLPTRPAVSTSSCTTPGCTACTRKASR